MVHCRSPTKCLKNGHFPSNQIQIVPDSNCCKLFMDNGLPAGANFSPDTSDKEHRPKANKKRRRTNMQKKAAFPCHLKATVPCGRIYGFDREYFKDVCGLRTVKLLKLEGTHGLWRVFTSASKMGPRAREICGSCPIPHTQKRRRLRHTLPLHAAHRQDSRESFPRTWCYRRGA